MEKIFTVFLLAFSLLLAQACNSGNGDNDDDKQGGVAEHEHKHKHEQGSITANIVDFHMTVLGDSIAVGMLSDTQLGSFPANNPFFNVLLDATKPPQHASVFDDYYKQNFSNAFVRAKHCDSLDCNVEHNSFHVSNLAISGARLSGDAEKDISAQLARADQQTTHYVLEAGANDFCAIEFNKDAFIAKMKDHQSKILARGDHVQLLIVPVPDIVHLFESVAPTSSTAFVDPGADPNDSADDTTYTCAQLRDGDLLATRTDGAITKAQAASCPRLIDLGDGAPDFSALSAELAELNAEIGKLHGGQTLVATSVAMIKFEPKHVAADCLHPSSAGLRMLGNEIFKAVQGLWKPYRVAVELSAPPTEDGAAEEQPDDSATEEQTDDSATEEDAEDSSNT